MSKQMGFYFDQSNCMGCYTCQVACKDKNDLEAGQLWRKVTEFKGGSVDEVDGEFVNNVYGYWLSMSCNHCEKPKCVENCPTGAMHKREEDGIVLVDKAKCIGCGYCVWSCPYGAPKVVNNTSSKCNFCIDLLKENKKPACVQACILRSIDYGPVDELRVKYGENASIMGLPSDDITHPSVVITPHKNALK